MSLKKLIERRVGWLSRRLAADGFSVTASDLSKIFIDASCSDYIDRFDRRDVSIGVIETKYRVLRKKYEKMLDTGFQKIRGWSKRGLNLNSPEAATRFAIWREEFCRRINPGDAYKNNRPAG